VKPWYTSKQVKVVKDSDIIEDIENLLNSNLPKETKEFLNSLRGYCLKEGGLTLKQYKALKSIEESFSPENILAREIWEKEYNNEKREIAKVCALYYIETPYFTELAKKVLEGEKDCILSRKAYEAMCENNYAKRVRHASFSEPEYAVGTLVKFRRSPKKGTLACYATGEKIISWEDYANKIFTVIGTDVESVTSPAKGAKKYHVLPFGSDKILLTEERFLKKFRGTP
tara:strand:+ start:1177 stop:1860 length:684 start_codon:yes stop_codon:yes gene_type:complete